MLNTRQLEVFCAVMETESISAAARNLRISQPAISKSIRLLEEALGFRLFERVGGRLHARMEAQKLYPKARAVFEEIASVTDLAKSLQQGRAGKLTVGASYALAVSLTPKAIQEFHRQKPLVDIQFTVLAPREVAESALHQDIDLGVTYEPVAEIGLTPISICSAEIVCILPEGHHFGKRACIHAADLATHKVISYGDNSHAGQQLRRNCCADQVNWDVAVEVNQTQAALTLVKAGLGVAVVDPFALLGHASDGILIKPFRPRTVLQALAVHAKAQAPSSITDEFIRVLLASVAELREDLPPGIIA